MTTSTPNDEPFRESGLDAQLDVLAHAADDPAAQTPAHLAYRGLAQHFAPQAAREAQAIARVRERLAAATATARPSTEPPPSLSTREPASAVAPNMPPAPRTSPSVPSAPRTPPLRPVRRDARRRRFLGAAAAVLAVGCLLGGFLVVLTHHGTPYASGYHWRVVPSPNTPLAVNTLAGITMRTSTDGWAWGEANVAPDNTNSNPISQPLIEHWDGQHWRIAPSQATPEGGTISAIAAVAADDAWAVGSQTTGGLENTSGAALVEHWDGHQWTIAADPVPYWPNGSGLSAVAALSADNVWAVGQAGGGNQAASLGLIQHWDGHQWQSVAHPAPGGSSGVQFTAITAATPNDIWVVGMIGYGRNGTSVLEHWDGSQWRIVPSPSASSKFDLLSGSVTLDAISAVSANDIWAAGYTTNALSVLTGRSTLFEHWDGRQWSVTGGSVTGIITGIAALAPNDVWAVGNAPGSPWALDVAQQGQGLIEHWDGQQWSLVASPFPRAYSQLFGVARDPSAAGKVWVAGYDGPAFSQADQLTDTQTLIETNQ